MLFSHGASARVKDSRAQLPLHRAAAIGSVPMVTLLLENKSPLNATDVAGYTALHHGESHFPHREKKCFELEKATADFAFISAKIQPLLSAPKLTHALRSGDLSAISEGHGDTALALLKAGAETDKRDVDGYLAIELAPDAKVRNTL